MFVFSPLISRFFQHPIPFFLFSMGRLHESTMGHHRIFFIIFSYLPSSSKRSSRTFFPFSLYVRYTPLDTDISFAVIVLALPIFISPSPTYLQMVLNIPSFLSSHFFLGGPVIHRRATRGQKSNLKTNHVMCWD